MDARLFHARLQEEQLRLIDLQREEQEHKTRKAKAEADLAELILGNAVRQFSTGGKH